VITIIIDSINSCKNPQQKLNHKQQTHNTLMSSFTNNQRALSQVIGSMKGNSNLPSLTYRTQQYLQCNHSSSRRNINISKNNHQSQLLGISKKKNTRQEQRQRHMKKTNYKLKNIVIIATSSPSSKKNPQEGTSAPLRISTTTTTTTQFSPQSNDPFARRPISTTTEEENVMFVAPGAPLLTSEEFMENYCHDVWIPDTEGLQDNGSMFPLFNCKDKN
jgi:hypothetical protein